MLLLLLLFLSIVNHFCRHRSSDVITVYIFVCFLKLILSCASSFFLCFSCHMRSSYVTFIFFLNLQGPKDTHLQRARPKSLKKFVKLNSCSRVYGKALAEGREYFLYVCQVQLVASRCTARLQSPSRRTAIRSMSKVRFVLCTYLYTK